MPDIVAQLRKERAEVGVSSAQAGKFVSFLLQKMGILLLLLVTGHENHDL